MATQGEDAEGGGRAERGVRVTLDIWHPDCWTLEVTAETDAGLLGHGVHSIDGTATGRFTAYADSGDELDALVDAIRASDLTESVWETDDDAGRETPIAGSATRGLVVRYDLSNSINDALVSRGFIPDEPVRMQDGREHWTVLVQETRRTVHDRLEEVREEMDADVRVELITAPEDGSGMFRTDALSERQREVYRLARRRDYYTWPREVSAGELAAEAGVSKATLLEHLRKAESKLLGDEA
ncbi:Predicted DNA binding protein, contains HTH domain [Halopelagius inordinatus]|uniref:Predicted DNA binding protein, contains HTH domain n=1 Tax=Halopelagius inordinatus TaxID=553467 RepID=A0A1I2RQF4_9EURY|nr:helix-turn-helix domain-containing protein [Halopelagius inordinatus]SFG42935.1 Predicted DNA binding protein, contains HTH domain [Halopelagius inordinatus]